VIVTRTARGVLISGLLLGLGASVFVATALAATGMKGGARAEGGSSTVALAWRSLHETTCALLFRYPVARPPIVRYEMVPEVAAGYLRSRATAGSTRSRSGRGTGSARASR
jgi:hypothetical protein